MRKMTISLAAMFTLVVVLSLGTRATPATPQTRNQLMKFQVTETFTFPNECTSELMEVTSKTVVTCHDQQRADGRLIEKCEIRQNLTAVGQSTGITFNGNATFKDELTAADICNFSFSNRGRVRLITAGSDVNLVLTFDDFVRVENCVMTANTHFVTADCRGRNQ
jgi:hypothetical protein